jgi:Fe-S cluster biogenesis protein NfuA
MSDLRATEARIERLLTELSEPPWVRERAEELVRLLVELYGEGLGRILGMLEPDDRAKVAADDLVGSLLILHDLHPRSTLERVGEALDQVRPYLGSHAGDVDLLGVDEGGVVRLALRGTCDGCPSSTVTAKHAIERAILEAAPEVAGVEVENLAPPPRPSSPGLLQIQSRPPLECPAPLQEAR